MHPEFTPFSDLPDVVLIKPHKFNDSRGYFCETYNEKVYRSGGITATFVQDNQSLSKKSGTFRGLHFQAPPHQQAKLVRCVRGAIFDVAVDIRAGSPTFGQWVSAELTAKNGWQIFIPEGFAHGFLTLTPDTEVAYKVNRFYDGGSDMSIRLDDPTIDIEWPIALSDIVLSERDQAAVALAEVSQIFKFEGVTS